MTDYIDKLVSLPPFFFIIVAILILGIVFSILKRVVKFSIFLTLIVILVFVVFVLL